MNIPRAPVEAQPRPVICNVFKTLLQTIAMWGVFLAILPLSIARLEQAFVGWQLPSLPTWLGWGLFTALGSVGLYCGFLFAVIGGGTPLPLDTATRFLVLGPYRWVRNPMALCGIGQGIAVGLLLRSPLVVLCAISGGIVWHWVARPWEERDLVSRFGEAYQSYRAEVSNWIPRLRPYPRIVQARSPKQD